MVESKQKSAEFWALGLFALVFVALVIMAMRLGIDVVG
jgi:hypothetical protein